MNCLTSDFITCRMIGRLGNQMFQIAHGYSQALTHRKQFVAPKFEVPVAPYIGNIFKSIDFLIDNTDNILNSENVYAPFHFSEVLPVKDKITIFHGYYQSEKYFLNNKNTIIDLFSPSQEFINKCFKAYPELASNNVTAINVRRGDYLTQPENHPVITKEFIYDALERIPNKEFIYVVSDDIPWCKDNIKTDKITFVEYKELDALWLLSLCKNFVISNSTFSWWGAYLSKLPGKVVVSPDTWFGPGVHGRGYYEYDIYADGWIKVPTYWDNGEIKLKA